MDEVISPRQCTGVENPLYPYFVPKQAQSQEESISTSSNLKQNIDFFNNLSTSSSFSKSPPQNSIPAHKTFLFSKSIDSSSNTIDFLSSSSTKTNGFSDPLQYNTPTVLSTFSSRKVTDPQSKPANGSSVLPSSYPSYPKLPVKNGYSPIVPSSSIIAPEAKDIIASILNNNSYPSIAQKSNIHPSLSNAFPTIPTQNGAFVSNPTSSTYASRAAFLNDQLGPAVPSISPKSSVSEWTKFD